NACSSCHISGNMDELAWDLGNPQGKFVAYGTTGDNVRFIVPQGNQPVTVPAQPPFSAHTGFDPQKGPMTTQTLRGMLEPLHWRGDRATLNWSCSASSPSASPSRRTRTATSTTPSRTDH
ncbi:MAG: hypothetical protein DMF51_14870, partial [Acidobacteria bacterium]